MVGRILGSELTATILVLVVPFLLGKAFAWWVARAKAKGDEKYTRAVEALEVGVDEAWQKLGRKWKEAHDDGKFTDSEKQLLREKAKDVAWEVAREQGLDVAKVVGRRALDLVIKKIVQARKRPA